MSELKKATVILFTAPWCGPCKTMKPLLTEKLIPKHQDILDIKIVDISAPDAAGEEAMAHYAPKSVPVLVSSVGHRHDGAMTESMLISWFNDVLATVQ